MRHHILETLILSRVWWLSIEVCTQPGYWFHLFTYWSFTVFQDSSHLRHQVDATDDLGPRHDYGNFIPVEDNLDPRGEFSSQNIGFHDNSYSRVEDLGQFWLWNLADFNPWDSFSSRHYGDWIPPDTLYHFRPPYMTLFILSRPGLSSDPGFPRAKLLGCVFTTPVYFPDSRCSVASL